MRASAGLAERRRDFHGALDDKARCGGNLLLAKPDIWAVDDDRAGNLAGVIKVGRGNADGAGKHLAVGDPKTVLANGCEVSENCLPVDALGSALRTASISFGSMKVGSPCRWHLVLHRPNSPRHRQHVRTG